MISSPETLAFLKAAAIALTSGMSGPDPAVVVSKLDLEAGKLEHLLERAGIPKDAPVGELSLSADGVLSQASIPLIEAIRKYPGEGNTFPVTYRTNGQGPASVIAVEEFRSPADKYIALLGPAFTADRLNLSTNAYAWTIDTLIHERHHTNDIQDREEFTSIERLKTLKAAREYGSDAAANAVDPLAAAQGIMNGNVAYERTAMRTLVAFINPLEDYILTPLAPLKGEQPVLGWNPADEDYAAARRDVTQARETVLRDVGSRVTDRNVDLEALFRLARNKAEALGITPDMNRRITNAVFNPAGAPAGDQNLWKDYIKPGMPGDLLAEFEKNKAAILREDGQAAIWQQPRLLYQSAVRLSSEGAFDHNPVQQKIVDRLIDAAETVAPKVFDVPDDRVRQVPKVNIAGLQGPNAPAPAP